MPICLTRTQPTWEHAPTASQNHRYCQRRITDNVKQTLLQANLPRNALTYNPTYPQPQLVQHKPIPPKPGLPTNMPYSNKGCSRTLSTSCSEGIYAVDTSTYLADPLSQTPIRSPFLANYTFGIFKSWARAACSRKNPVSPCTGTKPSG